jgi:hypothetical protein
MEEKVNEELHGQLLELVDQQLLLLEEQRKILQQKDHHLRAEMELIQKTLVLPGEMTDELSRAFLESALRLFGKTKEKDALEQEYREKKEINDQDVSRFRDKIETLKNRLQEEYK